MTIAAPRPLEGDPIGTIVDCGRCGRRMVRVAVRAPFPHKDWQHVDRAWCGGPAK